MDGRVYILKTQTNDLTISSLTIMAQAKFFEDTILPYFFILIFYFASKFSIIFRMGINLNCQPK